MVKAVNNDYFIRTNARLVWLSLVSPQNVRNFLVRLTIFLLIPICTERYRTLSVGLLAIAVNICVDVSSSVSISDLQNLHVSVTGLVLLNFFINFAVMPWVNCVLCVTLEIHVIW